MMVSDSWPIGLSWSPIVTLSRWEGVDIHYVMWDLQAYYLRISYFFGPTRSGSSAHC